jgi:hypothetical protein
MQEECRPVVVVYLVFIRVKNNNNKVQLRQTHVACFSVACKQVVAPRFPNHPGKTAPRFTNHLSQSDPVSRIRGPHFPNQGMSFPESSRCPVFLCSVVKGQPFPVLGHLISRIVVMPGFSMVWDQGAAVSRIGAMSGPEKGHLVSRISRGHSLNDLWRQSIKRKKCLIFQRV